ncbi:TPA: hypothetical protein ACH3X1_006927 [Trebouxia sp. C0004]
MDLRRFRERLQQAESELRANKQLIRDHQLAKCREALLPMTILEPGLVLQSVPKGHLASAKEMEHIREDYNHIKAEHEQRLTVLSDRLESQETIRRRAQKDLLKLREEIASSTSLSSSGHKSNDLETTTLVKEFSDLYGRLNKAKEQIAGATRLTALPRQRQRHNQWRRPQLRWSP